MKHDQPELEFSIENYFYKLNIVLTKEQSLKLAQAIFLKSYERFKDSVPGNLCDGIQTSKRFRIAFLLEELKEKKLLLKTLHKNMKVIQEKTPGFGANFIPNVVICYVVLPGGTFFLIAMTNLGKLPT